MGKHDRGRHQFPGFIAGITKHHALVAGTLSARGADGLRGAGGGGRVALYVDQWPGFDLAAQVSVIGGLDLDDAYGTARGGAGTVLHVSQASTYGDLVVDGEQGGGPGLDHTVLPTFGEHVVGSVEADTGAPADLWIEPQDPAGRFDLGVEGVWARVGGVDYRVIAEAGDRRRVLLAGAAGLVGPGDAVRGVYKFDSVTVEDGGQLLSVDAVEAGDLIFAGAVELDAGSTSAETFEVGAGADATVRGAIEATDVMVAGSLRGVAGEPLRLTASSVDVAATGAIVADGLGFAGGVKGSIRGGAPDGVTGSLEGGVHGGFGEDADHHAETYGDIRRPREAGGGAGHTSPNYDSPGWAGGAGGGLLEILADSVTVDGVVSADGAAGDDDRKGGAGGAIYIEATTLAGVGEIRARGAGGWVSDGGGGRIALVADSLLIDPLTQTRVDSVGVGGAGTVYTRDALATWGDLYIDGHGVQNPARSPLTELGEHEIASVTPDDADPANLWIETREAATSDPSHGMTGHLAVVQGQEYEILDQVDRRHLLLAGASAAVVPGMVVEGLLRFDAVHVRGGADVRSVDPVLAASVDVDAASSATLGELGPGLESCGYGNLLANASAEAALGSGPDGRIEGWTQVSGDWAHQQDSNLGVDPIDGASFLWPGVGPVGAVTYELRQDVDLGPWADLIDAGGGASWFSGHLIGRWTDKGRILVEFKDADGADLGGFDTGAFATHYWYRFTDYRAVPVGARTARVRLLGVKSTWVTSVDLSVSVGFDALRLHLLPAPALTASGDASQGETAGAATYALTLGCPRPQPVTVTYQTADRTATAPADYQAVSGSVTFAPGETSKSFTVQIVDDTLAEGGESFAVELASADILVAPTTLETAIVDDELGSLSLELAAAHPSGDLYPGAEVEYTATLTYSGGSPLQGVRLVAASSPELSTVPGSVTTSFGSVTAEQPLDVAIGGLAPGASVTVTYRAVLGAYPAGSEVESQLTFTATGVGGVLSDDPATAAVSGDATASPLSSEPENLTLTVTGAEEGRTATLNVTFDDGTAGDVHSATVDWGDGQAPELVTGIAGGTFELDHRYVQDGSYLLDVCVEDSAGAISCLTRAVDIANVVPFSAWQDLRTWTPEHFSGTSPSWTFEDAGRVAVQRNNSGPTALLSPFPAMGTRLETLWRSWGDSGTFGFVVGYSPADHDSPDADYLLAIWKLGTGGMPQGLRLFRVDGSVSNFADLDGSPQATLLATGATLGSTSASHSVYYEMTLELLPDRFRLWVDDGLEIDVAGDFSTLDGRLGLYQQAKSSNYFERLRLQAADAAVGAVPLAPFGERMLFDTFQVENPATSSSLSTPNWQVTDGGRRVAQTANNRPSFFVGSEPLLYRPLRGHLRSSGDDDYMGFALGFEPGDTSDPDADYVLVVWRQSNENGAARGLSAYRVHGVPETYWSLEGYPGSWTKLADAATYGGVGYDNNRTYRLQTQLEADRFRLWVDGSLEIDVAGTFSDGHLAFFSYAHSKVSYWNWRADGVVVEEAQSFGTARLGFEDPGLLDTHGATVDDGTQVLSTGLIQGQGVVSLLMPDALAADDLLHDVEACVSDSDGAVGCAPLPLRVRNVAPSVNAGLDLAAEITVSLDGGTFTDPGLLDTHTATVDWGDGGGVEIATVTATAGGGGGTLDASHAYAAAGIYTVTVCVVDDDGGEGCDTVTASLSGDPNADPPTVSVGVAAGSEGDVISLQNASYGGPGADRVDGATVDWGDGSPLDVVALPPSAAGGPILADHVFADDGVFTVEVCVQSASVDLACGSAPTTIANAAPFAAWQDLRTWTPEAFGGTAPAWAFDDAGRVATQDVESGPGALLSPFPALGARLEGQWRTWGDDGMAGLLVGYSPGDHASASADYLLVLWKRGSSGMPQGLRLFRISGAVADFDDLDGSPEATLLATGATFGASSPSLHTHYEITVELLPGRFRLWVEDGLELDVAGDFSTLDGGLGFYQHRKRQNYFERWRVQAADGAVDDVALAPFGEYLLFDTFQVENPVTGSSLSTPDWRVSENGRRLAQYANNRPSFFVGPEPLLHRPVRGHVYNNGDDDYMGLAFGFEPGDTTDPNADYVLVVWKRTNENGAARGLRAYRVHGVPETYWSLDDYPSSWTKLADAATYGDVGYDIYRTYRMEAQLEADRFRLWVDGSLEIDVAGSFSDGHFGFFSYAHSKISFRNWYVDGPEVDEGQSFGTARLGFEDPGLLDTHSTATVDDGTQVHSASLIQGDGVVSLLVPDALAADDLDHDVEACVTDDDGGVGCASLSLRVRNVAPTVDAGLDLAAETTVSLDGSAFTDPGLLDTHTATVDWGDGGGVETATVTATAGGGGGTLDASHAYAAAGTYTLTVCVVDDDGGEGCDTATATISGPGGGAVTTSIDAAEGLADAIDPARPLDAAPILVLTLSQVHRDLDGDGLGSGGDTVTYRLTVTNVGDGPATGVTVIDLLPSIIELAPTTLDSDRGAVTLDTFADGEQSVAFDVGTLSAGESATATFDVHLVAPLPPRAAVLVNQAGATADGLDVVFSDDPTTDAPGDPTRLWLAQPNRSSLCTEDTFDQLVGWKADGVTMEIDDTPMGGQLRVTGGGESLHRGDRSDGRREEHGAVVRRRAHGDFRVEVDIAAIALAGGGGAGAKGCLLAVAGAGPSSAEVTACYLPSHPRGPSLQFDARLAAGPSGRVLERPLSGVALPIRLALTRLGHVVTVSYSFDGGLTWHEPGAAAELPPAADGTPLALDVGVLVSGDDAVPGFAVEFDDWRLCRPGDGSNTVAGTPRVADPAPPSDL